MAKNKIISKITLYNYKCSGCKGKIKVPLYSLMQLSAGKSQSFICACGSSTTLDPTELKPI